MAEKAYLVLENGRVFEGYSFGKRGQSVGEVVFTTGMTGYLETLTDPSYHGQIIVQTFPLIGNYGVIRQDFESRSLQPRGYIVREWCESPSNFRSEGDINSLLSEAGIVGLCGIDTRALTRVIRSAGVMNGAIVEDPADFDISTLREYSIKDAVAAVSTTTVETEVPSEARHRVVLWDFGAKDRITRMLTARSCCVIKVPSKTTAEEIMAYEPDGIMLSNGPGDPAENVGVISELKKLIALRVPIFGICLGHQLLALAMGAATGKLKYGHRGANQPVKDIEIGTVSITTQNHGYAVDSASLDESIGRVRYVNANDGTCEGIDYRDKPVFSVQFHPEASAGPNDTAFLFDRFIEMMASGEGV